MTGPTAAPTTLLPAREDAPSPVFLRVAACLRVWARGCGHGGALVLVSCVEMVLLT